MPKIIYDSIIIGLGPAGMTAGIYCARKGLKALIIGKEAGGQVAKAAEIENYLGFGQSSGEDLARQFSEHLDKFKRLEHLPDETVTSIKKDADLFEVTTGSQKQFSAKTLIICSGRNPRKLNVQGEHIFRNKGVSYCEVCDAPLFHGKITAVIGGGNSALQATISLSSLCPKVYIINLGNELSADWALVEKIKNLKNVKIINNAQTMEIFGDKFVAGLKYKDLKTDKISKVNAEGVFIEIGWDPANEFDKLTKKNKRQEIIIDKQCKTNIPGLFAAGDVTDIGFYQIVVAAGEGAKAALAVYQYLTELK